MPPLHIGLTGNIASGKSTVARQLAELGATVIDADQLAREAVQPGSAGFNAVVDHFGPSVLLPTGDLDRAALRRRVFSDPLARDVLNGIVHPIVGRLRDERFADAAHRGDRVVISDIPLLFEVGLEHAFDGVLLVDAPPPLRRARLVRDRGLSSSRRRRDDRRAVAQRPQAGWRHLGHRQRRYTRAASIACHRRVALHPRIGRPAWREHAGLLTSRIPPGVHCVEHPRRPALHEGPRVRPLHDRRRCRRHRHHGLRAGRTRRHRLRGTAEGRRGLQVARRVRHGRSGEGRLRAVHAGRRRSGGGECATGRRAGADQYRSRTATAG